MPIKITPFLNCSETSRLVSLARDEKISPWQKLQIKIHLSMCRACAGFEELVKLTGNMLKTPAPPQKMPRDIRNRLQKKITQTRQQE